MTARKETIMTMKKSLLTRKIFSFLDVCHERQKPQYFFRDAPTLKELFKFLKMAAMSRAPAHRRLTDFHIITNKKQSMYMFFEADPRKAEFETAVNFALAHRQCHEKSSWV
jgi:hypothetical protein